MMKQKTNGRGIAFTLALALIFSTLFTGLGVPGFGQMGDKESWGVEEVYADAASAPTVDTGNKSIYANGTPLIVSQGSGYHGYSHIHKQRRSGYGGYPCRIDTGNSW